MANGNRTFSEDNEAADEIADNILQAETDADTQAADDDGQ